MNNTLNTLDTVTSNQTALSTGDDGWQTWRLTIGADEAVYLALGFSIGSLATAVCFMATRKCRSCRKKRDRERDSDSEDTGNNDV